MNLKNLLSSNFFTRAQADVLRAIAAMKADAVTETTAAAPDYVIVEIDGVLYKQTLADFKSHLPP